MKPWPQSPVTTAVGAFCSAVPPAFHYGATGAAHVTSRRGSAFYVRAVKTILLMFAVAILPTEIFAQSVVTQESLPGTNGTNKLTIVFSDDRFQFVARHYGTPGDPDSKAPGFFVYSKARDRWLQIVQISTKDATLGKSESDDPEERRQLENRQIRFDFTTYTNRPWINVPLIEEGGALWFPDQVEFDTAHDRYKMSYATKWKVKPAVTVLYVNVKDLNEQFDKISKP